MPVYLLQLREDAATRIEELETFAKCCGLRPHEELMGIDVFNTPLIGPTFKGVNAFIIGGSSSTAAYKDYEWTSALSNLVETCYKQEIPLFGSCWGHQFMARALGGTVIHDSARAEIGAKQVFCTEAAGLDPLFAALPFRFKANQGHHDRVSALPSEAIELAYSALAPYQAFRVRAKPIYGTQFHSELDRTTISERLTRYRSQYPETGDDAQFQALLQSFEDTPEAATLLGRFIRLYVNRKQD